MSIFLKLLGLEDDIRRAKVIMVAVVAGVFVLGALMGIAVVYHHAWVKGMEYDHDRTMKDAMLFRGEAVPADLEPARRYGYQPYPNTQDTTGE